MIPIIDTINANDVNTTMTVSYAVIAHHLRFSDFPKTSRNVNFEGLRTFVFTTKDNHLPYTVVPHKNYIIQAYNCRKLLSIRRNKKPMRKNWYSVPYEYVGKMVDIKVTETTLTTYYQNKRINVHKVFPNYVINKFHK